MTPVDQALQRVQVAIAGAGAWGLSCAAKLLRSSSSPQPSVLILEARDRVGGRIFTTKEKGRTAKGQDVTFHVDHGARWAHIDLDSSFYSRRLVRTLASKVRPSS